MIRIEPGLLFVQIVTFGVAVALLWRLFWEPLTRMMERRRQDIADDIAEAQRSRRAAEDLEKLYQQRLADIDDKSTAMMALAGEEAERHRDEILRQAREDAQRLVENARRQVSEEKTRAIGELRREAVSLAMLIARKAMAQSVDPQVQSRLVDEFIEELKRG